VRQGITDLNREPEPEEHVELEHALEDLVLSVHLLDPAVRPQQLVHLPSEFGINFPTKSNVGHLGDTDDDRDDVGEYCDGYFGEDTCLVGREDGANFGYLDGRVNQDEGVKDAARR
jgi:hypothetical protein